ncbi:MAG: Hsp70 family protein [Pseudomonadota bacterium]
MFNSNTADINKFKFIQQNNIVLGIDFGTSTSSASFVLYDKINRVKFHDNSKNKQYILQSLVRFYNTGDIEVGVNDSMNISRNSLNYINIYSIKRLLGKNYTEAIEDAGIDKHIKSYFINRNDKLLLRIFNVDYTPLEIAIIFFKFILKCYINNINVDYDGHIDVKQSSSTDDKLNRVDNIKCPVVVCIPVYFNDIIKKEIITSCEIAGFVVKSVLTEPVASCYNYIDQLNTKVRNYVVCDFGGGTLDLSIVRISGGKIIVSSIAGDANYGGDDIDLFIANQIDNFSLLQAKLLKERAVDSKIIDIVKHYFAKVVNQLNDLLFKSHIKNFDGIIVVGGIFDLDYICDLMKQNYNMPILRHDYFDTLVANGAALYGQNSDKFELFDVLPLSLGIEVDNGMVEKILFRHDRIPVKGVKRFGIASNKQTSMKVNIYQGEALLVSNCDLLGKYNIPISAHLFKSINYDDLIFEVEFEMTNSMQLDIRFRYIHEDKIVAVSSQNYHMSLSMTQKEVKNSISNFLHIQGADFTMYKLRIILNKFCVLFENLHKLFYGKLVYVSNDDSVAKCNSIKNIDDVVLLIRSFFDCFKYENFASDYIFIHDKIKAHDVISVLTMNSDNYNMMEICYDKLIVDIDAVYLRLVLAKVQL